MSAGKPVDVVTFGTDVTIGRVAGPCHVNQLCKERVKLNIALPKVVMSTDGAFELNAVDNLAGVRFILEETGEAHRICVSSLF